MVNCSMQLGTFLVWDWLLFATFFRFQLKHVVGKKRGMNKQLWKTQCVFPEPDGPKTHTSAKSPRVSTACPTTR